MQSKGRRCVSCFTTPETLGKENIDGYAPFAVKDALHFTIHDLQHMEKFVSSSFYLEQVGFLHCMANVMEFAKNESVDADKELRADLAHIISDMNTTVIHLLDFLVGKWKRVGDDELGRVLDLVFEGYAGRERGDASTTSLDPAAVRAWFRVIGARRIASENGGGAADILALWPRVHEDQEYFFRGQKQPSTNK
jgi:hypothetical protein